MSEPSLRESISAAMEGASTAPAPESPASAPGAVPERAPEAPSRAPEATPEATSRARAPDGRFAKQQEQVAPKPTTSGHEPTPPSEGDDPHVTPTTPEAAPHAKPPANMKARLRETWANVPKEFQEEFHRLNVEAKKALDTSSQARRTAEAFQQTVQPYMPFMQGEPMQVVGNLLQTAVQLQTAPPAHKAALVAQIIKGYGVDVNALADILEGQQPAAQPQQPQQFRDPRFDQFMGHLQQMQAQRGSKIQQEAAGELEKFASKAEFLEDVREEMADLMEAARKRGRTLTLEDAYERACILNPEVRPLYEQRKQVQTQANARASTQAARAASSSVRHEPTAPTQSAGGQSLRDSIEAAWAVSSRR